MYRYRYAYTVRTWTHGMDSHGPPSHSHIHMYTTQHGISSTKCPYLILTLSCDGTLFYTAYPLQQYEYSLYTTNCWYTVRNIYIASRYRQEVHTCANGVPSVSDVAQSRVLLHNYPTWCNCNVMSLPQTPSHQTAVEATVEAPHVEATGRGHG